MKDFWNVILCACLRALYLLRFFSSHQTSLSRKQRGPREQKEHSDKGTLPLFFTQLISGIREMSPCWQGDELKNVINVGWSMTLRPCNIVYNSLFNRLFQLNMNAKHTEGQQEEWEGEQAEKLNTKIQFSAPHLHFCTLEYNTSYFIW